MTNNVGVDIERAAGLSIEETADALVVGGRGYSLVISRHEPFMDLHVGGSPLARLAVASGLDTVDAFDEDTTIGAPQWSTSADEVIVSWEGSSSVWAYKSYELRARAAGFSYSYEVQGSGAIDRAHFFRTRMTPSAAGQLRIFNPEPTSGGVQYTGDHCFGNAHKSCMICGEGSAEYGKFAGPADFTLISVGRDKLYHDGNWFFTPSPLCLAFQSSESWLAAGIAARPGEWNFSELEHPGGGFGMSLLYKGHRSVDGAWRSPELLCLVAPDEYSAVERYCGALRSEGFAPVQGRGPAQSWWRQPIFCGWGEQISQEVFSGTAKAPELAAQAGYEAWLASLDHQLIDPGTVVIDDKWQGAYGLNDVDNTKWPDMPGFIAAQHERGRHVLLWLKAWDPEGVPADECIVDANGKAVAVDPSNASFRERFAAQVRYMLRDLDADGFKIDFTHLIPRGISAAHAEALTARNAAAGYKDPWPEFMPPVIDSAGGTWGLELLRQWLEIISDTTREVKADALVITHTANPYLADLVDALRLNDVAGLPDKSASIVPMMRHRVRVARAASPYWLIDADNWPCSTREQWRDYIQAQGTGEFGIPALYHAERFGWGSVDEPLDDQDYEIIRSAWDAYRRVLANSEAPV